MCVILLAAVDCSKSEHNQRVEKAIPSTTAAEPRPDPDASKTALPPPTAADVQQAVSRIYGDNVQPDPASSPHYVIGDFNGDDSPDLAVEVRPVSQKLSNLNDDFANWIVEDPKRIFVPDANHGKVQKLPPRRPREQVRAGEPLLAIVHGYGPQGWRETMAQQSYLLRNTGGKELGLKNKDVLAGNTSPVLFGDLIERDHGGRKALLFWTGGHYAWYRSR